MSPTSVEQTSKNGSNSFLQDAIVVKHNLSNLNKTRLRFRIGLKKASKKIAPTWQQILLHQKEPDSTSDLEKITFSEVGLRGISVFKALDEAASKLRQEIESIKEWMTPDNGDWVCSLELAPLVWQRMLYLQNELAPSLRKELKQKYEQGLAEFERRVHQFLSADTWNLDEVELQKGKEEILSQFPTLSELSDYLQVVINRPVIMPALSEQINSEQAECLNQITRFIETYDQNLEQRLKEAAIAGGEKLAAELLEELSEWTPGKKPVQFRKKLERHLQKIQVLLSNASSETSGSLQGMMEHLEQILATASVDAKSLNREGKSSLQERMDNLRTKLLGEQKQLRAIADEMGLSKATAMSLKLR